MLATVLSTLYITSFGSNNDSIKYMVVLLLLIIIIIITPILFMRKLKYKEINLISRIYEFELQQFGSTTYTFHHYVLPFLGRLTTKVFTNPHFHDT